MKTSFSGLSTGHRNKISTTSITIVHCGRRSGDEVNICTELSSWRAESGTIILSPLPAILPSGILPRGITLSVIVFRASSLRRLIHSTWKFSEESKCIVNSNSFIITFSSPSHLLRARKKILRLMFKHLFACSVGNSAI